MQMKLDSEWKKAWKWLQVQLGAVVAFAPEVFEQVKQLQGYISDSTMHHVMSGLGVLLVLNAVRKKTVTRT